MSKRFCVNTKGLTKEERKGLAIDLKDFVQSQKAKFDKQRQSKSKMEESEDA